jgi:2-C-methyl-D-erythritol 4-phosphate cytidylyltransferase
MQANLPKQYLMLGGRCVVEYTLECLLSHPRIDQVIIALHPHDNRFIDLEIASHPRLRTVTGGDERADSVQAGLAAIDDPNALVLVHDAARPCLQHRDIDALLDVLHTHPAALLARAASDTVKLAVAEQVAQTLPREQIWLAQTPQASSWQQLQHALTQAKQAGVAVTDEASALEYANIPVTLVAGHSHNIKITHPDDLALARFYLTEQGRFA